mmetsp:Transcript_17015/g.32201  ORF Transcript_17015/g.32201 Transcript_17015/m.32201 type:complete len:228 (+) Transcript_17015:430-1113(+)
MISSASKTASLIKLSSRGTLQSVNGALMQKMTSPYPWTSTNMARMFSTNQSQKKPSTNANLAQQQQQQQLQQQAKDPHQIASDMVKDAPDTRISGTEALASMTPEQRMRNYVTAFGLVSFCIGVWYYSIQSVGRADGGVDELRAEAQEAKDLRERKSVEEQNAKEMAQLDVTMSQYGDEPDDLVVAVAAPDEIAQREEAALSSGTDNKRKGGSRPLWKRVVFFWKRD